MLIGRVRSMEQSIMVIETKIDRLMELDAARDGAQDAARDAAQDAAAGAAERTAEPKTMDPAELLAEQEFDDDTVLIQSSSAG